MEEFSNFNLLILVFFFFYSLFPLSISRISGNKSFSHIGSIKFLFCICSFHVIIESIRYKSFCALVEAYTLHVNQDAAGVCEVFHTRNLIPAPTNGIFIILLTFCEQIENIIPFCRGPELPWKPPLRHYLELKIIVVYV